MKRPQLIDLTRRALILPTAPYHEQHIATLIHDECVNRGLRPRKDSFGNLLVHFRRGGKLARPLAFVAHMDHPGFETLEDSRNGSVRAELLGGITRACVLGAKVRIFSDKEVAARVERIESWEEGARFATRKILRLKVNGKVRRGDFGMWDLTPVSIRGDRLASRACDDLIGCVSLVAALASLAEKQSDADVYFVFTRAEEVGFQGALALARSQGLPQQTRIISVETSKEILPRARMGRGPIVRVGDRAAVFDSSLTRFLSCVAESLVDRSEHFQWQRCLMDGGTCEATAFGENGYDASGLCIALGNYHNIGPRSRVAAEYVNVSDLENLVRLIVAAVESSPRYNSIVNQLRDRLDDLHERAVRRLSPRFNLLNAK